MCVLGRGGPQKPHQLPCRTGHGWVSRPFLFCLSVCLSVSLFVSVPLSLPGSPCEVSSRPSRLKATSYICFPPRGSDPLSEWLTPSAHLWGNGLLRSQGTEANYSYGAGASMRVNCVCWAGPCRPQLGKLAEAWPRSGHKSYARPLAPPHPPCQTCSFCAKRKMPLGRVNRKCQCLQNPDQLFIHLFQQIDYRAPTLCQALFRILRPKPRRRQTKADIPPPAGGHRQSISKVIKGNKAGRGLHVRGSEHY